MLLIMEDEEHKFESYFTYAFEYLLIDQESTENESSHQGRSAEIVDIMQQKAFVAESLEESKFDSLLANSIPTNSRMFETQTRDNPNIGAEDITNIGSEAILVGSLTPRPGYQNLKFHHRKNWRIIPHVTIQFNIS